MQTRPIQVALKRKPILIPLIMKPGAPTSLQQLKEETLLHTVDPPSSSRGRRAAVFYLVLCTVIL